MSTTDTVPGIPEDLKAELRQTLDDLVKGIRRPDKMKAACERMDRMSRGKPAAVRRAEHRRGIDPRNTRSAVPRKISATGRRIALSKAGSRCRSGGHFGGRFHCIGAIRSSRVRHHRVGQAPPTDPKKGGPNVSRYSINLPARYQTASCLWPDAAYKVLVRYMIRCLGGIIRVIPLRRRYRVHGTDPASPRFRCSRSSGPITDSGKFVGNLTIARTSAFSGASMARRANPDADQRPLLPLRSQRSKFSLSVRAAPGPPAARVMDRLNHFQRSVRHKGFVLDLDFASVAFLPNVLCPGVGPEMQRCRLPAQEPVEKCIPVEPVDGDRANRPAAQPLSDAILWMRNVGASVGKNERSERLKLFWYDWVIAPTGCFSSSNSIRMTRERSSSRTIGVPAAPART